MLSFVSVSAILIYIVGNIGIDFMLLVHCPCDQVDSKKDLREVVPYFYRAIEYNSDGTYDRAASSLGRTANYHRKCFTGSGVCL